jgi:hypothetical protein
MPVALNPRRLMAGVRLLALGLKTHAKTYLLRTARGSFAIQLRGFFSRCAAALCGVFDAG